jgi:predicted phosphodiesterase
MDTKNILVIGDTHIPFHHPKYLQHCKDVKKYFKCDHVIHIGDELDHHASSYHESDVDGMSAGGELEAAIEELALWHGAFPHTEVILGNHSRIIWRQMRTAGLSLRWARTLADVLNTPTWTYQHRVRHNNVLYIHGEGVSARTKVLRSGCSVVQGHRHTEGYVWFYPNEDKTVFGMQVGTGIDQDSYAFAYAKDHPPPVLSCGVVLEHGTLPILLPMT